MSFAINPEQIKKREYAGLACLAVGLLFALAGLVSLIFSMPLGLTLFGLGVAFTSSGIFVLTKIPDLVSEENS